MTRADASLHDEVSRLERQQAALGAQIAAQQTENTRLAEQLRLLERGALHAARRRPIVLLTVLVAAAVVSALAVYLLTRPRADDPPTKLVLSRPLRPHVLITSEPPGPAARVLFSSDRMPESVKHKGSGTPFFFEAPPRGASYTITVEAEGYEPQTRTLEVTPNGGIHWHATLEPRPGGR